MKKIFQTNESNAATILRIVLGLFYSLTEHKSY